MERAPMAVVETKEFLKQAKPLMSDAAERAEVVAFVGANPEAGEIIPRLAGFGRSGGHWREWVSGEVRG